MGNNYHPGCSVIRSPLNGWIDLAPLRALCCQLLPTIFDDTMSYYEVLCKVKEILNDVIVDVGVLETNYQVTLDDISKFKDEVNKTIESMQTGEWLEGNVAFLEALLKQYIPVAIFFGLTTNGYFVANIPESWDMIEFGTTGLDTTSTIQPEFGHLVLEY